MASVKRPSSSRRAATTLRAAVLPPGGQQLPAVLGQGQQAPVGHQAEQSVHQTGLRQAALHIGLSQQLRRPPVGDIQQNAADLGAVVPVRLPLRVLAGDGADHDSPILRQEEPFGPARAAPIHAGIGEHFAPLPGRGEDHQTVAVQHIDIFPVRGHGIPGGGPGGCQPQTVGLGAVSEIRPGVALSGVAEGGQDRRGVLGGLQIPDGLPLHLAPLGKEGLGCLGFAAAGGQQHAKQQRDTNESVFHSGSLHSAAAF